MPKTPKVLQNRELGKQGDTFLSTRLDFATQEGMSTLSSQPGPPTPITPNDEIIAEMRDIESRRKKRASSTFQALSSIGSIFSTRRDDRQIRSGGLQTCGGKILTAVRADNGVDTV
ncbi:hypothetical protein H0H93_000205 [Arthromyces matolae]|nr:hypothetical protein H0H93_000205 [Arthromyces matolae]